MENETAANVQNDAYSPERPERSGLYVVVVFVTLGFILDQRSHISIDIATYDEEVFGIQHSTILRMEMAKRGSIFEALRESKGKLS